MYELPIEKEFSPSFWESEDKSQKEWEGFEGIVPGIQHALGRKTRPIQTLADSVE